MEALGLRPAPARRVLMTASCRDCDPIPKVPQAGEVDGEAQWMHNGLRIHRDCYGGAWMTHLIRLLRGHHEPQEEWIFHRVLGRVAPGSAMIELGASWSYYSLWFRQRVPDAFTLGVEPDPAYLASGRRNFELNGAKGEFLQALVGRASRPAVEYVCESDRQKRRIPVVCIDDLVERYGLARLELLHADVQGAELEVLEGAAGSIARGRLRFVFLATHHHCISGDPLIHQRCLDFVARHGGHVLAEYRVSESFSGDGLVVASFLPEDRALEPLPVSVNRPCNALFREVEYDLAEARAQPAWRAWLRSWRPRR